MNTRVFLNRLNADCFISRNDKEFEFSGPSSLDSVSAATVKSENTRSDAGFRQMAPDVAMTPKAMLSQKISIH